MSSDRTTTPGFNEAAGSYPRKPARRPPAPRRTIGFNEAAGSYPRKLASVSSMDQPAVGFNEAAGSYPRKQNFMSKSMTALIELQ